jgi:DNA-binding SARP family transcriptional activator
MIEIRTLGRTSVAVNREPLTGEAVWPKSLALIVYMAREPGPDRREEILGVLWPDRDEKRARRALNQLLYTLRKASPELDLESVSDALDFGREVWLDVEEFERRLDVGDLRGAVELYGGPFLQDLSVGEPEFDHWADRQRADLRRKFRKAALQLSNQAKQAGDLDEAVAYCRRLVEADALDDEAQHLFIECLYLRGDRLAALRQFERYRDVLQRELEVEPLDNTRDLVARIKAEKAPAEVTSEAAPAAAGEPTADREKELAVDGPEVELAGEPKLEPRAEPKVRRRPSVRWAPAALGVVAILAIGSVFLRPNRGEDSDSILTAGDFTAEDVRIAVLPFRSHGMGPDDLGLSDGIAQLLSLNLSERADLETVDYRLVEQRWLAGGYSSASGLRTGVMNEFAAGVGASALLVGDVHASGTGAAVRGHRDSLFVLLDLLAASLAESLRTATDSARPN